MTSRLQNKVAIVTGGASGIGRATVELIASEGGKVVLADIQDEKGLEMEANGKGNIKFFHCDVTSEADIKATVETATDQFGRLDALFNNAGTPGSPEPADGVSVDSFNAVMAMHLRAAFLGIKYAAPAMRSAGGGSIVSTASVAGVQAGNAPILYSTAKGALMHMTKVAALQLAGDSIRLNCVAPGIIPTFALTKSMGIPEHQAELSFEKMTNAAKRCQPIPRGGEPKDIAEAVVFFFSDAARWITGQTLTVDGGMTLGPSDPMAAYRPILEGLGVDMAALSEMLNKAD